MQIADLRIIPDGPANSHYAQTNCRTVRRIAISPIYGAGQWTVRHVKIAQCWMTVTSGDVGKYCVGPVGQCHQWRRKQFAILKFF